MTPPSLRFLATAGLAIGLPLSLLADAQPPAMAAGMMGGNSPMMQGMMGGAVPPSMDPGLPPEPQNGTESIITSDVSKGGRFPMAGWAPSPTCSKC